MSGDVSISIGVEGKSESLAAFREIQAAGKELADKFGELAKKGTELFLSFEALKKVAETFGQAIEKASQIKEFSEQTGIASDQLVLLQRSFENNGLSAETLGKSINKMQKSIADAGVDGSKTAEKLNQMGLSVNALRGLSPDQQFAAIAKQIAGIEDPALKAQAAMQLFGKQGGAMIPLLENLQGSMATAQTQLGTYAEIVARNGDLFHLVGNDFKAIGDKGIELATGFLDKVAPAIEVVTRSLGGIDAAKIGQQLGDGFLEFVDVVTGFFSSDWPQQLEAMKAVFSAAVLGLGDMIVDNWSNAITVVRNFFSNAFELSLFSKIGGMLYDELLLAGLKIESFFFGLIDRVLSAFSSLSSGSWKQMFSNAWTWFTDFASRMGTALKEILTHPIDFVREKAAQLFGGEIFQAMDNSLQNAGGNFAHRLQAAADSGAAAVAQRLSPAMSDAGGALLETLHKTVEQTHLVRNDFFGSAEAMAKVVPQMKRLEESGKKIRDHFEAGAKAIKEAVPTTEGPSASFGSAGGVTVQNRQLDTGLFKNTEGLAPEFQRELATFSAYLTRGQEARNANTVSSGYAQRGEFYGEMATKQSELQRETNLAFQKLQQLFDKRPGTLPSGKTAADYINAPAGIQVGGETGKGEAKADPMETIGKTLTAILESLGKALGVTVQSLDKKLPQPVVT